MTPAVVWLLPAHETTHYELMGEVYAHALRSLSEKIPIWGVSWNFSWPTSRRGYALSIWNGYGRQIGFWGKWRLRQMRREVEKMWREEGFVPHIIQLSSAPWAPSLAEIWKRRFSASISPPLPSLSRSDEELPFRLPTTGLPEDERPIPKTVCLFVSQTAAVEAAYIAEILALEKYVVYIVGTPIESTPLRNSVHRFPYHIRLRLGLSWIETELYALRASILILVGNALGEELLIELGRPWVCRKDHPLASHAYAGYEDPTQLPILLQSISSSPLNRLSPEEFTQKLVAYYTRMAKSN
ncbi:MAG: hypothetical protein N2170_03755 [Bacteroidia bacterium]|nr:hypothetical protein [Bacteroidia bacterium]